MADGTSFKRSGFTMSRVRPFTIAISAAALAVMTACGGSTTTPSAAPSATSPPTSSSPSASQAAPTGPATVQVAASKFGNILTDSRGFALYKFDRDQGGISVCYEVNDCAVKWPARLTAGAPKADAGANSTMLDTAPRKDGAVQVRYNKIPLYFYYLDKAPGDVLGQSVGGIWWLVGADGQPIKNMTPSPTS